MALALTAACGGAAPAAGPPAETRAVESGITGVLQDEEGQPLVEAPVLACMSTTCYSGTTNDAGKFSFSLDAPAHVVIKTEEDRSAARPRAAAMAPVSLTEPRVIDVGEVLVPTLPDGPILSRARAGAQGLDVGDGLRLTLQRSALTPAPGGVIVDAAARRIPAAFLPRYRVPAGEELLAVYALHPFAATSSVPIPVRAPSDTPAGTRVLFRTISEIDGRLSDAVPGRATGTYVATDSSRGIDRLTYLVISR